MKFLLIRRYGFDDHPIKIGFLSLFIIFFLSVEFFNIFIYYFDKIIHFDLLMISSLILGIIFYYIFVNLVLFAIENYRKN